MPQIRQLDIEHLRPGRAVSYEAGDILQIAFRRELRGFGVHFAPFDTHAAWKLRVANSAVGMQTYAQSQRFTLDGVDLALQSIGDEALEIIPYRGGRALAIHAEHPGILRTDTGSSLAYKAPDWAYDFWFSTPAARMSEEEIMAEVTESKRRHLNPTVWLFDANWESHEQFLHMDHRRFPSGNAVLQEVRQLGIRPIMWLPPWIPANTSLWNFFNEQGWFVRGKDGKSLVFPVTGSLALMGSYFDVTSASFVAYFKQEIGAAIDRGIVGFMSDFGEVLPDDAVLACTTESAIIAKQQGLVGHNWYVGEVKQLLSEATKGRNVCLISRAGWTDSSRHTGLWLGDQSSDNSRFAGLISVAWGYHSALQAGYRFIGMDIGGYFGRPVLRDYKHWLDMAVCMPFAMHHGSIHANPWEEGEAALAYHRAARKKHQELWTKFRMPHFTIDRGGQRIAAIKIGSNIFDLTNVPD